MVCSGIPCSLLSGRVANLFFLFLSWEIRPLFPPVSLLIAISNLSPNRAYGHMVCDTRSVLMMGLLTTVLATVPSWP